MRILFVVESLRINTTSSGIVSSTFLEMFSQAGHEILVLTQNNFDYPVTWLNPSIKVVKFDEERVQKNWIDKIPKVRALPTYLTGLSKQEQGLKNQWIYEIDKKLKEDQYDLIYALGSGSEFLTHIALGEMNLNIPFYVNVHDPFPIHLYPIPYRKEQNNILLNLEKRIGNTFNKAKGISFPSQYLMEDMSKYFPIIKEKGFVIPHIGTTLNHGVQEIDENNEDFISSNKINLLHAGSLLGPRDPKFIIQAFLSLKEEEKDLCENVVLTFLGKIAKELKESVVNTKEIVFFNKRVTYQKSLELTAQSDALLVVEAISDFSPFMPGKLADILFLEKPILALTPHKSEVSRVLGTNYPYICRLDDVTKIKEILKQLIFDLKNNSVSMDAIHKGKEYVSIERNAKLLNQIINE